MPARVANFYYLCHFILCVLKDILSELASVPDVLLVVRAGGVVSEIRSGSMVVRQKGKWITIGDNDGPCHMHVDAERVRSARFVEERKAERTSFSVQFFDGPGKRILAGFFTKMYTINGGLDKRRKTLYDSIRQRYGSEIVFDPPKTDEAN